MENDCEKNAELYGRLHALRREFEIERRKTGKERYLFKIKQLEMQLTEVTKELYEIAVILNLHRVARKVGLPPNSFQCGVESDGYVWFLQRVNFGKNKIMLRENMRRLFTDSECKVRKIEFIQRLGEIRGETLEAFCSVLEILGNKMTGLKLDLEDTLVTRSWHALKAGMISENCKVDELFIKGITYRAYNANYFGLLENRKLKRVSVAFLDRDNDPDNVPAFVMYCNRIINEGLIVPDELTIISKPVESKYNAMIAELKDTAKKYKIKLNIITAKPDNQ
jgi:hypothetical protein